MIVDGFVLGRIAAVCEYVCSIDASRTPPLRDSLCGSFDLWQSELSLVAFGLSLISHRVGIGESVCWQNHEQHLWNYHPLFDSILAHLL